MSRAPTTTQTFSKTLKNFFQNFKDLINDIRIIRDIRFEVKEKVQNGNSFETSMAECNSL